MAMREASTRPREPAAREEQRVATAGAMGRLRTPRARALAMRGLLGLIILIWAFPVAWVAYSSFKPAELIISRSLSVVFAPTVAHYRAIFETHNFARFTVNSLVVATVSTVLCVVVGFLAAYGMARFRAGGASFSLWILVTRMAPPAAVLIPFYLMFRLLGLIHTLTGLVLVNIALNLSFAIWILRSFLDEIPVELEESAMVDGASRVDVLRAIVVPLARPGLVTTAIFSFVFAWNEYLFALVLATSPRAKTLPVAAGDFVTAYAIEWGPVFASGTLILIPVVILTLFLQRYIMRGLTLGAFR
jgi:multiple sugar transport system permease protein